MIVANTDKRIREYLSKNDIRWEFANKILYKMCEDNPCHDDEHVIVAKLWLIGRSYAAAIERRKNASESNDDFYYDVVAPKMLEIGEELDSKIAKLKSSSSSIKENLEGILSTHKFLMDVFYELTTLEKRSLASKYLHFHCPEKFFIYDSRAREAVAKLVKKPDKSVLPAVSKVDSEYAGFVCRLLEMQDYWNNSIGTTVTPRKLDSFLLSSV